MLKFVRLRADDTAVGRGCAEGKPACCRLMSPCCDGINHGIYRRDEQPGDPFLEGERTVQTAKLFKNGRSQAVRLPAEFRFEGDEVLIRRDPVTGDVILSPRNKTFEEWLALRDRLLPQIPQEDLDNFMADRDQGPPTERDWP